MNIILIFEGGNNIHVIHGRYIWNQLLNLHLDAFHYVNTIQDIKICDHIKGSIVLNNYNALWSHFTPILPKSLLPLASLAYFMCTFLLPNMMFFCSNLQFIVIKCNNFYFCKLLLFIKKLFFMVIFSMTWIKNGLLNLSSWLFLQGTCIWG